MSYKKKACTALTAVFPNSESFAEFVEDSENQSRLQSFVEFAARHGVIDTPTTEAFKRFIIENKRPQINESLDDLTLEELIDNRRTYLNIRISIRSLIDKINDLLINNDLMLPPLNSSMFTRLKRQVADTPRKRDALRSFAFWIGFERGDRGSGWHYETLKALCRENVNSALNNSCGVRIAFSISGRGHIIGQDIITWMKRTIRNTLIEKADLLANGNTPKIKTYDLTTFQVDLPNADQSTNPSAYANTLKEAIDIAHQLTIKWILSPFSSYNRFFSIGVATGDFDEVNDQLQAILNAKLPEDPVIRLTDYARQCVVINQIKVIMNYKPEEIELYSGERFKVWWITELSGMIHWGLVPGLINDGLLGEDLFNAINLRRQLSIPTDANSAQDNSAINRFFRFPQNSMLGFEIVRTLLCKKKFAESMEILNALLRVTPYHLNSRITRMVLYKYLGVEAVNYYISDKMFRMAEKEAAYIVENLNHIGEDFYYEYALLKLARLSTAIKALRRQDNTIYEVLDLRMGAPDLILLLNEAEEIVMEGVTVSSPTVERIIYLTLSIEVLKIVLYENIKDDGRINPRLTCSAEKIKQHMLNIFISQYNQALDIGTTDLSRAMRFTNEAAIHDGSMIALDGYRSAQMFATAVFYWDILPVRNVHTIKETLAHLNKALTFAKTLALMNEPVYSIATLSGQLVSADLFVSQVDSLINEIETRYKKASELEKMDSTAGIGRDDDDLVLLSYHI